MPNRTAALAQLLQADPGVGAMTKGRVYTWELPDAQVARMPRFCLVLSPAGSSGTYSGGYQEFSDERIDIRHYAYTLASAYDLYFAVFGVLNQLVRTVMGDTVLHWCRKAGGPVSLRAPQISWPGMTPDPSLHWPAVNASWQVLAADVPPGGSP